MKKNFTRRFVQAAYTFIQTGLAILLATWRRMRCADVPILASSLAFTTVISLVPLLAVSLSVFKAYGGFANLMKYLEPFILENFVEASGAHVSRFISASVDRIESGALGVTGAVGLVLTSTKVFFDMETAVQRIWREAHDNFRWQRLLVYWAVMFFGPLVLAVGLGLIGSKGLGVIFFIPKKTVVIFCLFVAFYLINKFVPASQVRFKAAAISALFASFALGYAQVFYARFTVDVLRYSKIYGSLASIPIFLVWLLILWWISLASVALCAVLNSEEWRTLETAP